MVQPVQEFCFTLTLFTAVLHDVSVLFIKLVLDVPHDILVLVLGEGHYGVFAVNHPSGERVAPEVWVQEQIFIICLVNGSRTFGAFAP